MILTSPYAKPDSFPSPATDRFQKSRKKAKNMKKAQNRRRQGDYLKTIHEKRLKRMRK